MDNGIIYEHPLTERIRIFLRLEYLFNKLNNDFANKNLLNILINLLYILEISKQFDLRLECLQALDKINTNLSSLLNQPDIEKTLLDNLLTDVNGQINNLKQNSGKFGESLLNNEWLRIISHKLNSPSGLCLNEIPFLNYWLNSTKQNHQKIALLSKWISLFEPLKHSIALILSVIRNSSQGEQLTATQGTFNKTFAKNNRLQLIRVQINNAIQAYPEISGNNLYLSIRFVNNDLLTKTSIQDNIEFLFFCCF